MDVGELGSVGAEGLPERHTLVDPERLPPSAAKPLRRTGGHVAQRRPAVARQRPVAVLGRRRVVARECLLAGNAGSHTGWEPRRRPTARRQACRDSSCRRAGRQRARAPPNAARRAVQRAPPIVRLVRIAVIADCHIDHGVHGLWAVDTWLDACGRVADLGCDAFVVAGDLFHTGRPSSEALISAVEGFRLAAESGAECVLVAGNHEWIGVTRQRHRRSPAGLLNELPSVAAPAEPEALRLECGLWLGAAPWPTPGGDHDVEWVDQVAALADDADTFAGPRLLVAHTAIGEARFKPGSERELRSLTRDWSVPVSALDLEPFDAVRAGHIHRRQFFSPYVGYVGSPERFTFIDEDQPRGFSLLEWDDDSQTFTDTLVETARQHFATVNIDTDMSEMAEGTMLRMVLRDGEAGHAIDRRAIEDAGLRLVSVVPPASPTVTDDGIRNEPDEEIVIDPAELLDEWAVRERITGEDLWRLLDKGEHVHGWA